MKKNGHSYNLSLKRCIKFTVFTFSTCLQAASGFEYYVEDADKAIKSTINMTRSEDILPASDLNAIQDKSRKNKLTDHEASIFYPYAAHAAEIINPLRLFIKTQLHYNHKELGYFKLQPHETQLVAANFIGSLGLGNCLEKTMVAATFLLTKEQTNFRIVLLQKHDRRPQDDSHMFLFLGDPKILEELTN